MTVKAHSKAIPLERLGTEELVEIYEAMSESDEDICSQIRRAVIEELEERHPEAIARWSRQDAMPQSLGNYVLCQEGERVC